MNAYRIRRKLTVFQWIKHWFAWVDMYERGPWLYRINKVTKEHMAVRIGPGSAAPDWGWLRSGRGHRIVDKRELFS